jgi:hypothetical protein
MVMALSLMIQVEDASELVSDVGDDHVPLPSPRAIHGAHR